MRMQKCLQNPPIHTNQIHYRADHNIRWYSVNRDAIAGYGLELFDSGAKDIWGPDAESASFSADGVVNTRTVGFNVTVRAYLAIKAQTAFKYWANEKYFKQWLGADAICDGVVGGKFSASAAVGQKIEGFHLALEAGAFVAGRMTSPLEEKDNLFVVSFKPFRRGTNLVFTHYVNDPTAAAILQVAWSQAIGLLKNVVEAEK